MQWSQITCSFYPTLSSAVPMLLTAPRQYTTRYMSSCTSSYALTILPTLLFLLLPLPLRLPFSPSFPSSSLSSQVSDRTEVGLMTTYNLQTSNVSLGLAGKYVMADGAAMRVSVEGVLCICSPVYWLFFPSPPDTHTHTHPHTHTHTDQGEQPGPDRDELFSRHPFRSEADYVWSTRGKKHPSWRPQIWPCTRFRVLSLRLPRLASREK